MSSSAISGPLGASILVLDADDADRRFVEIGLQKTGRFQVESAASAEAALEILRGHVVDLILTEVALADGDAFQLMKKIRTRPGGKDLPVIFLTRDKRGSVLASALQSGAVDFIGKPFGLAELLARADAVISRNRERRLELVKRNYSLAGDLDTVSFADLIHLLEIGNREGQLFFTTARGVGEIRLQKGRIIDASFGSVQGAEAFYALMREPGGRFEFQPGLPVGRVHRTITLPTTTLLMEGARLLDMHRMGHASDDRTGTDGATDPTAGADIAPAVDTSVASGRALPRPAAATPDLVEDLEAILADPFSLGEMTFRNRGELVELTTSAEGAKRCLGVLVAPRLAGVSVLAGMSSPLAEAHICSALDWDQRVLVWSIEGSNGAALDLVLLDHTFPAMVLDDFRRGISFAVYAPPKGDHLSLPHHAQGELEAVLGHLRPEVLMALGNATIGASIDQLSASVGLDARRLVVHRPIEDPGTDFRQYLVDLLNLWGKQMEVSR